MKTILKSQFAEFPEFPLLIKLYELSKSRGIKLYLVGGSMRDLLLKRDLCDYDFALSDDPISFTRDFANSINASFVILDEGNLFTSRAIYKKGSGVRGQGSKNQGSGVRGQGSVKEKKSLFFTDTRHPNRHPTPDTRHPTPDTQTDTRSLTSDPQVVFDFTKFRGSDIIEDLRLRDVSVNAIAVDFNELFSNGYAELIDPYQAFVDLKKRRIRFVSGQSVIDDPLRMLRAHRLAGALNFEIDPASRDVIKTASSLITQSAWERIRDEFLKILSQNEAVSVIRKLDEDGILTKILPEVEAMKGVSQNQYHHLDVWEHSLLALEIFESNPIPTSLKGYLDQVNSDISERIGGYERSVWLKFALLLHDIGKPITKSINDLGRISFFKHEVEGSKIATQIAERFKLSTKVKGILETIVLNHLRTMHLSLPQTTKKAIYRFIKDCKGEWLGVLLVSHADLCASRGILRKDEDIAKNLELMTNTADIYFKEILPNQQSPKLISGDELIKEFNLQPGPLIGEILAKIEEAKIEGKVKNKAEAMKFVHDLLRNGQ